MPAAKDIIKQYYDSFNAGDMNTFFALLDNEVLHDINQGETQKGKETFVKFMDRMNKCYKETIKNLIIFTNENNDRAAAEFIVEGTYQSTDAGLPPAQGQKYSLPGGAFFEIKNGKIYRITNYYNIKNWIKQVETK